MNTIATKIKEYKSAQPFRPVRFVLGDQQTFVVKQSDYLMISPDRRTVHFYDKTGHFKILNVQQIKLVETLKRASSKSRG